MTRLTAETQHMVCWLPWLPLWESVALGSVTFWPFKVNVPLDGCDDLLARDLCSRAERFINIHAQPVKDMTIAVCNGDMTFPVLSDDAMGAVLNAARLLMLAFHAGNAYFSPRGAYVNSAVFEVVIQRFIPEDEFTTVVTRRRDGYSKNGGYELSKIRDQAPRAMHSCRKASPDKGFLHALNAVAHETSAHHRRIANSLAWFALANTDSFSMSETSELVLLQWSIDHLLNSNGSNCAYQKSIMDRLNKFASQTVDLSARPLGQMPKDVGSLGASQCPILRQWAFQHYLLRNDITHGNNWRNKEWRWSIGEHCVFAAWLYPLLVKLILSEHSEYTLTGQDTAALRAIDTILASDDWNQGWQNAISRAADTQQGNRG
ncbi:MAG: hypothetical protein KAV00_15925 [Phycisphaerae bacterium]|nr:hypothetical protein [Phycisphaerae bacterium]